MVFSDPVFLFFFLPAVILCVKLCPKPWKNAVLLFFSLLFYAWGEPLYVLLMLAVIGGNYLAGRMIGRYPADTQPEKRRRVLWLAVAFNLGCLGYFKYTGFLFRSLNALTGAGLRVPDIVLPIGISFYTFQSMSYVIDVYRGEVAVQESPLLFGTYVSLFPQLIAGPIVRYRDIARELGHRRESLHGFAHGTRRFLYGLAKKVLLANQMGLLADRMLLKESGTLSAWVGVAAYSLQIYFDFSGYSDMAIGLGRLFGFHFLENFNYPYMSRSITEFWRRWHISLSSWFREYVYIPLGGNRKGTARQCLNLLIVWMLTGLWHGAAVNFLLWGLYYALLLIVEKQFTGAWMERLPVPLRRLITLLLVAFGWGIFYFTDMSLWGAFVGRLFGFRGDPGTALRFAAAYIPLVLIACLAATDLPQQLLWRLRGSRAAGLEIPYLLLLFLLCVSALVSQSYNPFIYFRF